MKAYPLVLIFALLFAVNAAFAQAPIGPSNGNATPISRTQLLISWQDNSSNENGFDVFTYPDLNPVARRPANSTSMLIPGLAGGVRIRFAVVAFRQQGRNTYYSNAFADIPAVRMPDEVLQSEYQVSVGQSFSAILYSDDSALQASANVNGLPGWATFNEGTRTLSGTPNAAGIYPLELVVNYSDGFSINETITLEVIAGPTLTATLPSPEYYISTEPQSIDLNTYFVDPDSPRAVRMTFNVGTVDMILYENVTPVTVSNFLDYILEDSSTGQNRFDGSMVHRSVPGFIIQGGGYRPTGGSSFGNIPDFGPIINEPGLGNVRGTIAMAKLGGDPNSATSEWFINLADNRSNLDAQNGGFTVFGRVAGNGMDVVDTIAALPTGNYPDITVDGVSRDGLLSDCPMNVNTGTAPASMEQDKLVVLESAVEIDPLTYEIVSNADPSVAQATISNGTLQVTQLKSGNSTLRIRATDLDGNQSEEDIVITVASLPFEDWSADQGLDTEQRGILDDADGDFLPNIIEYALFGDSTASTPSLIKPQKISAGTSVVEDYLAIEFSTRNGIEDTIVCVEIVDQLSSDATWTEIWNLSQGSSAAQVHSAAVAGDHIDWVIHDTQPDSSSASRFMRVRVERLDSQ